MCPRPSQDVSLTQLVALPLPRACCLRLWLAIPPLRPASRASSLLHSWALPFWCAALPPLLAISRCFARSIDANPRSSLATVILHPGTLVFRPCSAGSRGHATGGCNRDATVVLGSLEDGLGALLQRGLGTQLRHGRAKATRRFRGAVFERPVYRVLIRLRDGGPLHPTTSAGTRRALSARDTSAAMLGSIGASSRRQSPSRTASGAPSR